METKAKLPSVTFPAFSLIKKGEREWLLLLLMINDQPYLVKSVFIVLVEWLSKLQCSVSNMTVLKYIFEMFFWSCSFLKTLLAVSKSPSNSKQRQGTFQVSRGAASPALSLILTGKIAEWALLAFSFHFPLLLSPSLFPKPSKYPNFHLPWKTSTPCPSVSLNQHIVF